MEFETLSHRVIGCAIEVHRNLGPGLLESAYRQCLAYEFASANIRFIAEKTIPVEYKGVKVDCGLRLDMLVEEKLVVELKAVGKLVPLHQAQLLTYMKMSGAPVGILINFNSRVLRDGLKRLVI